MRRSNLGLAARMWEFWFMVLMMALLAGSTLRLAHTWRLAAEFESTAVSGEGQVLARWSTSPSALGSRPARHYMRVAWVSGTSRHEAVFRVPLAGVDAIDRDSIRMSWLPRDPRIAQIGNERVSRPWYELPVLMLLALFAALPVAALRRELRMRRAARASGTPEMIGVAPGRQFGPLAWVRLFSRPGAPGAGLGQSLWMRRAHAEALVGAGHAAGVRVAGRHVATLHLDRDLPP